MDPIPEIYPEGVKLLIQVDDMEKVTRGGIILPESSVRSEQRRLSTATVLRLGPRVDVDLRLPEGQEFGVGTRIIFAKYGGFNLKDPDRKLSRDFRLINDEDVLAVVFDDTVEDTSE